MAGRQATRTRQKYKDSCTHCAGAKVRCSKEKPRCARCHERGLECSYGLSYRYGRLPARAKLSTAVFIDQPVTTTTTTARTSTSTSTATTIAPLTPRELLPNGSRTPSPASESAAMPMSWLSEANMNILNAHTSALHGFTNINYDTHAPNNFMGHAFDATHNTPLTSIPPQAFQASGPLSDPIASTAGGFSTMTYIPCLDTLHQLTHRRQHSRSVSSASSLPSGFDYSTGPFHTASPVAFGTPPETPRAPPVQGYHAASMQHDCLPQAAATLLSLRHESTPGHARNRETMEYIFQMLDCDCFARDGHMRMFMVLIGFEVMDMYSRATRDDMMLSSTEGFLGDLQMMLKLIERLLRRLRETGTGTGTGTGTREGRGSGSGSGSEVYAQGLTPGSSSPTCPSRGNAISVAAFGQLETDLRKHLRSISHNTVDAFRRV